MKTYLLNIPNELRNFNQKLDVQAQLCSRTWEVFNDEGYKQVLIFKKDGKLRVSVNGNVINSTWEFEPTNKSIVITVEDKITMLHPAFLDQVIFALEKDGTKECLFMIDENRDDVFPTRSLAELKGYFQMALQKKQSDPQYLAEKAEEERKKKAEEQCKKEIILSVRRERIRKLIETDHADEIKAAAAKRRKILTVILIAVILLFVVSIICTSIVTEVFMNFILPSGFFIIVVTTFLSSNESDVKVKIFDKYWPQYKDRNL